MPPPDRPSLTHLFLGGLVDRNGAFDVLQALLLSGSGNLVVELPQVAMQAPVPHNGVTPGLSHSEPLKLPGPAKQKKQQAPKTQAGAKRGQGTAIIVQHLLAHGPSAPVSIRPAIADAGYSPTSISTFMAEAKKGGFIKQNAAGLYRNTAKGRMLAKNGSPPAKASKKERAPKAKWTGVPPDGLSQEAFVLKMITDNMPTAATSLELKAAFKKYKMRPDSVSVALATLKRRGLVTSPEKRTYKLVEQSTPANSPEGTHGSATT